MGCSVNYEGVGMDSDKSLDIVYSGEGIQLAYESRSWPVNEARRIREADGFDDEDRKRQHDADDS